jgi:hypothetical protein
VREVSASKSDDCMAGSVPVEVCPADGQGARWGAGGKAIANKTVSMPPPSNSSRRIRPCMFPLRVAMPPAPARVRNSSAVVLLPTALPRLMETTALSTRAPRDNVCLKMGPVYVAFPPAR